jgi:predicted transcriptional regulator
LHPSTNCARTSISVLEAAILEKARDPDLRKISGMTEPAGKNFIDLTANIVSAYVSNNPTPASEIPALIGQIHAALLRVSTGRTEQPQESTKPAVPVKKSMTPDYLVCLEDGKRFKSLKRHLRTQYNMTPEQYRDKWGLPADYPMVAPNYAVARSQLAKKMGLGQQRRRRK